MSVEIWMTKKDPLAALLRRHGYVTGTDPVLINGQ